MNLRATAVGLVLLVGLGGGADLAGSDVRAKLQGGYLAFSFDHNLIYGEAVTFQLRDIQGTSRYLKCDLGARLLCAYGQVELKTEGGTLKADELVYDLVSGRGTLTTYGSSVEVRSLGADAAAAGMPGAAANLGDWGLDKIQQSFLYATAREVDITSDFEAIGRDLALFVEGALSSVGFKRLNLSIGSTDRVNGFRLNKIWYTHTQGLVGRFSYTYEKPQVIDSFTQVNYEERSFFKDYVGLERQLDLQTVTNWHPGRTVSLGLVGNYNSSSLASSRLWVDKTWADQAVSLRGELSLNKPVNQRGEAWFGLRSRVATRKLGEMILSAQYETQNQWLADLSYKVEPLPQVQLALKSSYSQVKIGGSRALSKIFDGGLLLSYSSPVFNLASDYRLHHDLVEDQTLSQPQLRLGINPIPLYSGLLRLSISNVFIHTTIRQEGDQIQTYSNNTALDLSSVPLALTRDLSLNFSLALEQFLEKEKRNFTSGGIILNARQSLGRGLSLEGFYSFQSRRRTQGGLIEGTTSEDLSAVFRANPSERLNAWVSLSCDPKRGRLTESFADVSLGLIKYWQVHSLINYDFLLGKVRNIDLYVIRQAGRFQLRFVWRSLSRQILVEFVPS